MHDEAPEIAEQRERAKRASRRATIAALAWGGSIWIFVGAGTLFPPWVSFSVSVWLVLFLAWFALPVLMTRANKEKAKLQAMLGASNQDDATVKGTASHQDPGTPQDDLTPRDDLSPQDDLTE